MLYNVAPELFARYPGYVRGVVVVTDGINLEGPIDEVARMLKQTQEGLRARDGRQPIHVDRRVCCGARQLGELGLTPRPSAAQHRLAAQVYDLARFRMLDLRRAKRRERL